MGGCFLDTTIVIALAESDSEDKKKSEKHIKDNRPAETPLYAHRELLAGYIQILCQTHNILRASDTLGEALLSLSLRPPAEGRKILSRIQNAASLLQSIELGNPTISARQALLELTDDLALKIARVWSKARKSKSVALVQPLTCFNDGDIAFGSDGELIGPNRSFHCHSSERCAAASYLYQDQVRLNKLIDALHPNNLSDSAAQKRENSQRKKALEILRDNGPVKFDKGRCRALGDAYFAAMCPPGSHVITTNISDHDFLCRSLNKEAKQL